LAQRGRCSTCAKKYIESSNISAEKPSLCHECLGKKGFCGSCQGQINELDEKYKEWVGVERAKKKIRENCAGSNYHSEN